MKLGSIEKCLRVFDLLCQNPQGLRLSDISRALDLPTSSVHHILRTLLPHDYISQDSATKKYALGYRFLEIGRSILNNFDIRHIARDHIRELQVRCGLTVHVAVLRNNKVIYVDKVGSPVGLSLATYVGFATEPHAAGGGKVLLAGLTESDIKKIYPDGQLKQYGKNTITSLPALMAELEKVREQGYALDDGEYYEGVRCVAAPIRAGGNVVAALSITGSVFAMTMERIESEFKEMVIEAAERISSGLQW